MKLLFASSEGAPYIKSGGLGDVIYALPNELANDPNNEICIFLPYYKQIKSRAEEFGITEVTHFTLPLGWRNQYVGLFTVTAPKQNIRYYFIDNEFYFNRDTIYGHFDDGERFAFFSKAILACLPSIGFAPDVIHCHDWQTALLPLWRQAYYADEPLLEKSRLVFTIHNIEYQGQVPNSFFDEVLGLGYEWFYALHYGNCLNFMKCAIEMSDQVTTVSRTYADEIRYPFFAHGLQHILQRYEYKLSGIVNGIDQDLFNPETDPCLVAPFTADDLSGKAANKAALQEKLGLPVDPDVPMIAMITRLVSHKGVDLVEYVAQDLMNLPIQFVVIGTGEDRFCNLFYRLAFENPKKMSANILFDPVLAQQLYASADFFLMPSKSEPCGLAQLISMRYGTIPIVREVGGLYDTVPPLDPETMTGRGFTFKSYNAHDMLFAVERALDFWQSEPEKRQAFLHNLMMDDLSWKQPVSEYMALYQSVCSL